MGSLKAMVSRNIKCYLRTRSNIVYSLMSVIIIVGLYVLFLSRTYTDQMKTELAQFSATNIQWLSDSIMLSGLIPIISITVSLVVLGIMVEDKEKKIALDFMVAPINRNLWTLSYLITSFLICAVASFGLILFSGIYLYAISGYAWTFLQILSILGVTLLGLFFGNVFMLFVISFAKTANAVGGIGTIVGTMLGFVSGCYMPLGVFPDPAVNFLNSLPFAQNTSLIRKVFLERAPEIMNIKSEGVAYLNEMLKFYGTDISFGSWQVPTALIVVSILLYTTVLAVIAGVRYFKLQNK